MEAVPGPEGPKERQLAILDALIRNGTLTVERLAELCAVSTMTVYRDLAVLEERGIVQRNRGHVVAVASGMHEADAGFRIEQSTREKRAVAAAASHLVPPGGSVMVDDSTSGVWLLRELPSETPLTVITNSLLVADEVAERAATKLIVAGGTYQGWARSLMGPSAVTFIRSMRADFCFLSASGVRGLSCFHPYQENVEVKRAMLESAEERVLLLDHTKLHRRALFEFARLDEFDRVFIDRGASPAEVENLRSAGVAVTVADETPPAV